MLVVQRRCSNSFNFDHFVLNIEKPKTVCKKLKDARDISQSLSEHKSELSKVSHKGTEFFFTNSNCLIPISLQSDDVNL